MQITHSSDKSEAMCDATLYCANPLQISEPCCVRVCTACTNPMQASTGIRTQTMMKKPFVVNFSIRGLNPGPQRHSDSLVNEALLYFTWGEITALDYGSSAHYPFN